MSIVGYFFDIRSERRLCEEVHLNLVYRLFRRLGLQSEFPDSSTFSKSQHGRLRESLVFRVAFEEKLARCVAEGLVRCEGYLIDASVIKAGRSFARCTR